MEPIFNQEPNSIMTRNWLLERINLINLLDSIQSFRAFVIFEAPLLVALLRGLTYERSIEVRWI